ncbi:MAG: SpoIIE family protein phosphatase [Microscillaceae bacterium]|nr:SpoIIE family protein phosphatase [Microscillaceae bacterium]
MDKLDRKLKTYLKQEEGGQSRDGMDLALLVIDEGKQSLEFAGAKNPLFFVRQGELQVIKSSKYPVGGDQIKNKEFFSYTMEYEPGDVFYLFSDGFQDQFGGLGDRKFGSKRFRELIVALHHLPFSEQKKQLEESLQNWQGTIRQTDDILVMGFRFR